MMVRTIEIMAKCDKKTRANFSFGLFWNLGWDKMGTFEDDREYLAMEDRELRKLYGRAGLRCVSIGVLMYSISSEIPRIWRKTE